MGNGLTYDLHLTESGLISFRVKSLPAIWQITPDTFREWIVLGDKRKRFRASNGILIELSPFPGLSHDAIHISRYIPTRATYLKSQSDYVASRTIERFASALQEFSTFHEMKSFFI